MEISALDCRNEVELELFLAAVLVIQLDAHEAYLATGELPENETIKKLAILPTVDLLRAVRRWQARTRKTWKEKNTKLDSVLAEFRVLAKREKYVIRDIQTGRSHATVSEKTESFTYRICSRCLQREDSCTCPSSYRGRNRS
jgi:hypothetical protein